MNNSVKTILSISLNRDGETSYVIKDKIICSYVDSKTGENKTKVSKPVITEIPFTKEKSAYFTDFFSAFCDVYASQFVYTALKTVYANSPLNFIRELMIDCIRYSKSNADSKESFELFLSKDGNILPYIESADVKEKFKQVCFANEKRGQEHIMHTYTMKKDTDGKKHKFDIVPYIEKKNTKFLNLSAQVDIASGSDVEDLIQTANVAMSELVAYGLVKSPCEMWYYSSYIYNAVNHAIMSERAKRVNVKDIEPYTIKNTDKKSSVQEKQLFKIERNLAREQLLNTLLNIVIENAGNRTNKELLETVFKMYLVQNLDTYTIAEKIQKDQKQVMRYISYIRNIIQNDATRELIYDIAN